MLILPLRNRLFRFLGRYEASMLTIAGVGEEKENVVLARGRVIAI